MTMKPFSGDVFFSMAAESREDAVMKLELATAALEGLDIFVQSARLGPMPQSEVIAGSPLDKLLTVVNVGEEQCFRCGWTMGQPPLNCQNDDTPHVFPSTVRYRLALAR